MSVGDKPIVKGDAGLVDVDAAQEVEFGGSERRLLRWQDQAIYWICVAFTLFHLIVLNIHPLDPLLFRSMHVAWGSVIGFALFAAVRGQRPRSAAARYRGPASSLAMVAALSASVIA